MTSRPPTRFQPQSRQRLRDAHAPLPIPRIHSWNGAVGRCVQVTEYELTYTDVQSGASQAVSNRKTEVDRYHEVGESLEG